MTTVIISAVIGILIGGIVGYVLFRYVITGKYKQMIEAANNEAEVIKEKKHQNNRGTNQTNGQ